MEEEKKLEAAAVVMNQSAIGREAEITQPMAEVICMPEHSLKEPEQKLAPHKLPAQELTQEKLALKSLAQKPAPVMAHKFLAQQLAPEKAQKLPEQKQGLELLMGVGLVRAWVTLL